jgi:hypothetical protein
MNLDDKYFKGMHYYTAKINRKFNNKTEKFIAEYCRDCCNSAFHMDMGDFVSHIIKVLKQYTTTNKIRNKKIKITMPYEYQRVKMGGLMQYKFLIKGYKGAICSIYNLLYFTSTGNYESPNRQNEYLTTQEKKVIHNLFLNLRKEKLKDICDE